MADVKNRNGTSEVTFKQGEIIIEENRSNDSAYRIMEGTVEVVTKGKEGPFKLAELSENSIFGEMSLVDDKPPSATVKALTDVRLARFDKASFKKEIELGSPFTQELMAIFIERLRKADNTMVLLSNAEQQQRRIAELNKEKLIVSTAIAQTAVKLQNVFHWEKTFEIIEESLLEQGFTNLKLDMEDFVSGGEDSVELSEITPEGVWYAMYFHGVKLNGRLELFAPNKSIKADYSNILMIYNGLLSSCLSKSEAYDTLSSISAQVDRYISETRIREITKNMKKAIESFSERNMDILMAIPDRIQKGDTIEDISMELLMEFQEVDRLVQELEIIKKVFDNILKLSKGQLPAEISDQEKFIDRRGDQSAVDELL